MMKISQVRKAPRTGLGKAKRKNTSLVYLDEQWHGEKVVVLRYHEFKTLLHKLKNTQHLIKIKRLEARIERIRKMAA